MKKNDVLAQRLIGVVSVLIPIVVAVLLFLPESGRLLDLDVSFLPHLNGMINTAVSILLILAFYNIKKKNISTHRMLMTSAFVLSSIFLISYVIYHYVATHTSFGGEGVIRSIYFFLLISHIILAVVIVPLVLFSFYFSLTNQINKHKKLSRWTFPVWLYVSVTGVIVYLMISPYYN